MTVTSSLPTTQYSDLTRANKDNGDVAHARHTRDSVAEQKAVAELRKDAPALTRSVENRAEDQAQFDERELLGSNLDVKA